ncbi:MAG: hypothetical protein Ta2B_16570 [Termitinemataceae bacterium]|nr:MAG: hypothetical protein Ta2B_16570 [Termitinemataceae bacterium]
MPNNKSDAQSAVLKKSYQPIMVGDSYRPIPENAEQTKSFIPPSGGTGARTIQIKAVNPSATTTKK